MCAFNLPLLSLSLSCPTRRLRSSNRCSTSVVSISLYPLDLFLLLDLSISHPPRQLLSTSNRAPPTSPSSTKQSTSYVGCFSCLSPPSPSILPFSLPHPHRSPSNRTTDLLRRLSWPSRISKPPRWTSNGATDILSRLFSSQTQSPSSPSPSLTYSSMVLKVVFSVLFNIFSFLFEFLVCDWF